MTVSEGVIFAINFILYTFANFCIVYSSTYMLTPKYSRWKTVVIWLGILTISGSVKFFMPLYSEWDMAMAVIDMMVWLILAYLLCKEGIVAIIIAFSCINIIQVIASLIWYVTPYVEAQNTELGTTVGYLMSIPLLIVGMLFMAKAKQLLLRRNLELISIKVGILTLIVAMYYVMITYVPVMFSVDVHSEFGKIAIFVCSVSFIVFMTIIYMVFKKSEEHQQIGQQRELEMLHAKEQEDYNLLLKRTEAMEKIRHDFYGQLTTAKHIISQDRQRGMELLGELEETLR